MLESFGFIQDILHHLNYFWVMVLMAIESSFIPFPSEVVVPPAAYKAATGEMDLFLVILFATIGSDIGALVNYYLAKYLGRPIVYKFAASRLGRLCLLSPEKVEKAEGYFVKNGVTSTLVGRLVPGIRQLISIPAGLSGMPVGRFLLYTTIGAGAWNVVLALLGWFIGKTVPPELFAETIKSYSSAIGLGIVAVLVVGGLAYYLLHRRKK
ncbi:MAG: DedA family protein [Porphyromonadaceae bacterium]|nr:DedA family protein [Porphyromonadaceae bacterium]